MEGGPLMGQETQACFLAPSRRSLPFLSGQRWGPYRDFFLTDTSPLFPALLCCSHFLPWPSHTGISKQRSAGQTQPIAYFFLIKFYWNQVMPICICILYLTTFVQWSAESLWWRLSGPQRLQYYCVWTLTESLWPLFERSVDPKQNKTKQKSPIFSLLWAALPSALSPLPFIQQWLV